jgi:hypothetical protein
LLGNLLLFAPGEDQCIHFLGIAGRLDDFDREPDAFVRFQCRGFKQFKKFIAFAEELLEREHTADFA